MEKTLNFENAHVLSELYKNRHENLEKVEKFLGVEIVTREDWLKIESESEAKVELAARLFNTLSLAKTQGMRITQRDFDMFLEKAAEGKLSEIAEIFDNPIVINLKRRSIVPKNISQKHYLRYIQKDDIVFGIGPAGTGKTYLAVAAALSALQDRKVEKIILTRPAVEAGEALGFLPGDLTEKLQPYLRPLYDAMYDMIGPEEAAKLVEKRVVEIAPLAYMRGRTLSNAYIILDEAQNTTPEQMMMFLTRLGENSRMIITGDITQIDLPRNKKSGLRDALNVLERVEGIKLFYFDKSDVIRHPLVAKIVEAYEAERRKEESGI